MRVRIGGYGELVEGQFESGVEADETGHDQEDRKGDGAFSLLGQRHSSDYGIASCAVLEGRSDTPS
jgi:hypothetical protein